MSALGFLRTATAACLALACGSIVVTSCMTPEFTFDDGSSGVGTGGDGNEGGNGGTIDHCKNRRIDPSETDIDCGGIDCPDCELGQACKVDGDCVNGECTLGKCQDASCTDGTKNGTETGEDCGGKGCGPCGTDQPCERAEDCSSKVCTSGKCKAPTCTDRKLNQNEVDVDCGGECDPCDVGDDCVVKADCQAPAATVAPEANAQPACTNMICELACDDSSRGDCNGTAADGCETSLLTSVDHCSGCDVKCNPPNAAPKCDGGVCGYSACNAGFVDIDPLAPGCEVNHLTDPLNCGTDPTNLKACSANHGTPSCVNGVCDITCDTGFDDCDGNVNNGCEADLSNSTTNCTECGKVCPLGASNQSPYCNPMKAGDPCGLSTCPVANTGDCDGDQNCTNDLTSVASCGACGNACTVLNGTPRCASGSNGYACQVDTCQSGTTPAPESRPYKYMDCDGDYDNGCEVDVRGGTANSINHCGACTGANTDCAAKIGTQNVTGVTCTPTGCKITSCAVGFDDCNGLFSDGCEVNTQTNSTNCGGCQAKGGDDCTAKYANGNGTCSAGACTFTGCKTNFADCQNGLADGCEVNTQTDKDNCNGCGMKCNTDAVTSANTCTNGVCNPTCTGNGAKCDSNGYNGCEDRNTDASHCGACGTVCALDSVTSSNACSAGSCVPMCITAAGGASCDGVGTNGCEDTKVDANHCGGCNIKCDTSADAHVSGGAAGNPCLSSVCTPSCAAPWGNCDGIGANGCETNTSSSVDACGGCGAAFSCAGTNVTTRRCISSACSPICGAGWCPAADPKNGCTAQLGTKQNCGSCGTVCSGTSPFCGASGCEHRPVVVKNDTATGTRTLPGALNITHALSAGVGNFRVVVVGVTSTYNNVASDAPVVRYNNVAMTQAVNNVYSTSGQVGIYYMLDAALPAAAGNYTVSITSASGWGSLAASVVELGNVDQTPAVTDTTVASSSNCAPVSGVADVANPNSFVFAAAYSQGNGASGGVPEGLTMETLNTFVSQQNQALFGYVFPANSNATVGWTPNAGACWATRLTTVTFSSVYD